MTTNYHSPIIRHRPAYLEGQRDAILDQVNDYRSEFDNDYGLGAQAVWEDRDLPALATIHLDTLTSQDIGTNLSIPMKPAA